jgi:ATP-dependent 26S proteasome regulatory subunit|tara:strand:+ start:253 stop:414 length:162 start_codon:yes stop_codon:yes gene_type:complete
MFFARFTVRSLREELHQLQEPGSYVGEVVKVMGKKKVLVKVRMRESAREGEGD